MPGLTEERNDLCAEIQMTPVQCNEVIEDKLSNLMPVVKGTLDTMKRVNDVLENGGINWRQSLKRAIKRMHNGSVA